MTPIATVAFSGTFKNIPAYTLDAAPREGGMPSEHLEGLIMDLNKKFKDIQVKGNPYDSPTQISITGNSTTVSQADEYIRRRFEAKGVNIDYTA